MDEISTHREYEALDKQITEAKEKEANVRAELLKEEKRREDLYESLKIDEETIASLDSELKSKRDALEGQVAEYKSQLDELKEKEESIVPDLNKEDPEIVYKFQRIIKRNSEGIVAVERGVCMGCHMILPAQFANEVHNGEKIVFCPYCSRILFYQDVEEGETEYFHLDDTGSLSDLDDDFADEEEGDYDEDSEMSERDDGDEIKNLDDFD
jgi:predicted  nucleic acid-binding Zn-ribbon protein